MPTLDNQREQATTSATTSATTAPTTSAAPAAPAARPAPGRHAQPVRETSHRR
jgi:hypothetical protein